jgi:pilus assembly protein CpaE
VRHAPKSKVQSSLTGLAQALYGKPVGSEIKGSKWGFFSKR